MKAEQERLKHLLIDSVKVFVHDSVKCHNAMTVEGLIGITLNNEVFLVYVNESCTGVVKGTATNCDSCGGKTSEGFDVIADESSTIW